MTLLTVTLQNDMPNLVQIILNGDVPTLEKNSSSGRSALLRPLSVLASNLVLATPVVKL